MRTSERVAVILFLILLLMVVYQNCGMPPRVSASTVRKLSEADLSSLQALDPVEKKIICESSSFYSCQHEMFGPEQPEGNLETYTRCTEIGQDLDRLCANVTITGYNTAEALRNCAECSAEDGLPGGKYNRELVRCQNHAVKIEDAFPVHAESPTLEASLTAVVESCKAILQY